VTVQQLTSAAEVLLATGHDVFARASLRRPITQGWHSGAATLWWGVDQHDHSSHVSALGEPGAVGELLAELLQELPPRQRVTLPRGTGARLPAWVGLDGTDWDFRWTGAAPPLQPGEERVVEVTDAAALEALLTASSPTASALPGDGKVHRWFGVPDGSGGLLACAADTSTSGSVGHLKSIAVHPDARGQGLGKAVTAALTRALLSGGCDVVTLGMYATNTAGRALYDALGFADDHRVTSGLLEVRSRW
jgi:GNAT superfamily N-acetyltransferase